MKKAYVIFNDRKPEVESKLAEITQAMARAGIETVMSKENAACEDILPKSECYEQSDFVLVVGGDGTILSMAQSAADYNKPVLGINLGTIGFLTELEITELNLLENLRRGEYFLDKRSLLEVSILGKDGEAIFSARVLNEAVVSKGTQSRAARLSVLIDGNKTAEIRGDGVIVATPTGSTAYSLSAGGPVLSPKSESLVITPICPMPLNTRAFVVNDTSEVTIEPSTITYVSQDGFSSRKLQKGQRVRIKKADKHLSLIRLKETSFYERVRLKL